MWLFDGRVLRRGMCDVVIFEMRVGRIVCFPRVSDSFAEFEMFARRDRSRRMFPLTEVPR